MASVLNGVLTLERSEWDSVVDGVLTLSPTVGTFANGVLTLNPPSGLPAPVIVSTQTKTQTGMDLRMQGVALFRFEQWTVRFRYRVQGTTEWSEYVYNGFGNAHTEFTALLRGLTAGTTYEIQARYDGRRYGAITYGNSPWSSTYTDSTLP